MYAADFFFLGGGGSWEISTNFAEIVSVFCTYDYNNSWKFKIKYTLDHFHYIYIAWFEYLYVEYARFVWLILKLNQLMQLIPDKNHLRTTVDYTRRNEITRFWQLLSHLMLLSGRSFMKYISCL